MKEMKTNLAGRVRNLPHFRGEALLPLFEAVINSIQAIEEKGNLLSGEITVRIIRHTQQNLNQGEERPITGFDIIDNGIGFTNDNFESFETSDSEYKKAIGGKGLGRFLWLKAFTNVKIDSVFVQDNKRKRRRFDFNVKSGVDAGAPEVTKEPQQTTVHLIGFKKDYQGLPSAYKTTAKIAQRILEHCLSYFIAGGAPRITVDDGETRIVLNDAFNKDYKSNIKQEELELRGKTFSLTHLKLYSTRDEMHNIVLCADKRDVKRINLGRALGTSSQFDDEDRRFTYALYVASPYLDEHADYYRLDFDLPEDTALLGEANGLSMKEIREALTASAKHFLSEYLEKTRAKKQDIVTRYVSCENPALRAVPFYCPEIYDEIEPNSSEEKIDEVLYYYKGKAEFEIRKKSAELLKTQNKSFEEIEAAYKEFVKKIEDFRKDNLVKYLCDRKYIIAVLEKKLELNREGKYANEDIIHDVIFPRKTTTDEIAYDNYNLWLIDEVLAFHEYAASDIGRKDDSEEDYRPDVVSFAEIGEDKIARAVSLIEFKKPQRKAFDKDPTEQLFAYLKKIQGEKPILMANGRELHVSASTRYYLYAICDLTTPIRDHAQRYAFALLPGNLGYYFYNPTFRAHLEILDYDQIVADAKRRHRAFFDRLGIS